MKRVIQVLVVDGALATGRVLADLLRTDPRLVVAADVAGGQAALDFLRARKADVVLMDIHMVGMDGYEATRAIMESSPVPIVLCSTASDPAEVATAFRAFEAGAVAVVGRPGAPSDPDFERLASEMLNMVRLMSEVKVVRRWPRKKVSPHKAPPTRTGVRLVGIGASTGGPPALQTILAALPKEFALPILVVQHIAKGFLPGLVDWLGQTTALQVQIASHGTEVRPGHVYLAPDDFHLEIGSEGRIHLTRERPESNLRPSVDRLFRSMAEHCGHNAIAVLLTGMGKDGAAALKALHDCGAHTIVQDRDSSVVHGMPGAAIQLNAAREILHVDHIADALRRVADRTRNEADPQ